MIIILHLTDQYKHLIVCFILPTLIYIDDKSLAF